MKNRNEHGGVLVMVAVLIPLVFIPILMMVFGFGMIYAYKGMGQNAADAAALAGAGLLAENLYSDDGAIDYAVLNGIDRANVSVSLLDTSTIEVIVSQEVSTPLLTVTVKNRAVATTRDGKIALIE